MTRNQKHSERHVQPEPTTPLRTLRYKRLIDRARNSQDESDQPTPLGISRDTDRTPPPSRVERVYNWLHTKLWRAIRDFIF